MLQQLGLAVTGPGEDKGVLKPKFVGNREGKPRSE